MAGLAKYDEKNKRRERRRMATQKVRRNHVARDLLSPKYAQRIVPGRKPSYNDEETRYDWPIDDNP